MPSDYEKLNNSEIDSLVATRLMGPDTFVHHHEGYITSWRSYSTDDTAVRLVRDRIYELGEHNRWANRIVDMLDLVYSGAAPEWVFAIAQATPRQQCIAALQSLDTRETEGGRT